MVGWFGCKEVMIEILGPLQATRLPVQLKPQSTDVGRGPDERWMLLDEPRKASDAVLEVDVYAARAGAGSQTGRS